MIHGHRLLSMHILMIHGHRLRDHSSHLVPPLFRVSSLSLCILRWALLCFASLGILRRVCRHEDTCGNASSNDLKHAVDEAVHEDAATSAENGVRCGNAERDRWVERATGHGTDGVTASCDARTNGKAKVLAERALHGGHREHDEGEQECEHDLCNCCLSPAVALAWAQWERLALHGGVSESCSNSGNDLNNNVDAGILRRALVAACGNDGNGHRRVEV